MLYLIGVVFSGQETEVHLACLGVMVGVYSGAPSCNGSIAWVMLEDSRARGAHLVG